MTDKHVLRRRNPYTTSDVGISIPSTFPLSDMKFRQATMYEPDRLKVGHTSMRFAAALRKSERQGRPLIGNDPASLELRSIRQKIISSSLKDDFLEFVREKKKRKNVKSKKTQVEGAKESSDSDSESDSESGSDYDCPVVDKEIVFRVLTEYPYLVDAWIALDPQNQTATKIFLHRLNIWFRSMSFADAYNFSRYTCVGVTATIGVGATVGYPSGQALMGWTEAPKYMCSQVYDLCIRQTRSLLYSNADPRTDESKKFLIAQRLIDAGVNVTSSMIQRFNAAEQTFLTHIYDLRDVDEKGMPCRVSEIVGNFSKAAMELGGDFTTYVSENNSTLEARIPITNVISFAAKRVTDVQRTVSRMESSTKDSFINDFFQMTQPLYLALNHWIPIVGVVVFLFVLYIVFKSRPVRFRRAILERIESLVKKRT
jgi:hypothetical protein